MNLRLILKYGLVLPALALAVSAAAQKGLPSKQPFTATVNTMYPQREDFNETMVNRLKAPAGFKISVAATGLGKPRIMALADDGSILITRRDVGDVLLISDKDGDGRYETLKTVWAAFPDVHGITLHDGWLYLASSTILKRGKLQQDGSVTDTATLIKDLPDGGQHDNRMIAFGGDGKLYMTVGSDCNDCAETNKELATMLVMNADGTGRKILARGLRNTVGFDWQPDTKEIWGCDNGGDWRGDEWPPEELNKIVDGGDYGWPWVYAKQEVDITREDPAGTTKADYAKNTQPAVMLFPAHSAPIDFRFLKGPAGFPADFKGDALVAWHGSWNRKVPQGYKVERIHFVNGQPQGSSDFVTGFLSADGKTRIGRPAGIIVSKKGKVFISDDESGVIYCVSPVK